MCYWERHSEQKHRVFMTKLEWLETLPPGMQQRIILLAQLRRVMEM